jgi:hypothetical protein
MNDITLETIALDAPDNVAAFITNIPAKGVPKIYLFPKSNKSQIFRLFYTDCHST